MVYMCHIFPVESIIDGHLGWFQVFNADTSLVTAVLNSVFFSFYFTGQEKARCQSASSGLLWEMGLLMLFLCVYGFVCIH